MLPLQGHGLLGKNRFIEGLTLLSFHSRFLLLDMLIFFTNLLIRLLVHQLAIRGRVVWFSWSRRKLVDRNRKLWFLRISLCSSHCSRSIFFFFFFLYRYKTTNLTEKRNVFSSLKGKRSNAGKSFSDESWPTRLRSVARSRPFRFTMFPLQIETTRFSLEVAHLLERLACRESAGSFKRNRGALEVSLARRRGIERLPRWQLLSASSASTRRFAWPGLAPTSGFTLKLSASEPSWKATRKLVQSPTFVSLLLHTASSREEASFSCVDHPTGHARPRA